MRGRPSVIWTLAPPAGTRAAASLALCLATASALAAELPQVGFVAAKFPPYTLETETAGAGPTADLIAMLARRVGQKAVLQVLPLPRALMQAEAGSNTMIALIARTMQREDHFYWICPVLDYDVSVFRRRDRPDVVAADIAGLAQWKIASANRDVKTAYLLRHDVPVITTADEDTAARLLVHARASGQHPPAAEGHGRETRPA